MKEASGVRAPMASGLDSSIRAVANSGLRSAHHLFSRISGGGSCHELGMITQHAVGEFKTLLILLDRSLPRRIRKGPLLNSPAAIDPAQLMGCNDVHGTYQQPQRDLFLKLDGGRDQRVTIPARRPILCSASADGSSIGTQLSSYYLTSNSVQGSMDESSVLSSKRKLSGDGSNRCTASAGGCHCSNRRNIKIKRSMRVPAVSNKLAEIPYDDFTWRKYGQKPIKGSPYPSSKCKSKSLTTPGPSLASVPADQTILVSNPPFVWTSPRHSGLVLGYIQHLCAHVYFNILISSFRYRYHNSGAPLRDQSHIR